ncbi:hypothetical protein B1219_09330 [Pseudomonas ogarae]|nr:hypothetical protein B1219_09330 [Pseudomonas ogarae]OPG77589.1 hypothetical protein B1218_20095 [Pseudomonas ogarae]
MHWKPGLTKHLWRGSLLPLGGEAAPKNSALTKKLGPAAQSSGSKLPRHKSPLKPSDHQHSTNVLDQSSHNQAPSPLFSNLEFAPAPRPAILNSIGGNH